METKKLQGEEIFTYVPFVTIKCVAVSSSNARVADIEVALMYADHVSPPQIRHGWPTSEELLCNVLIGSCSYIKE